MLAIAVLCAALIASLLTGGRFRKIENFRLRALPLGLAAFIVQLFIFPPRGESPLGALLPMFYVLSLAMLVGFLLANLKVFGVSVLLVGLLLNFIVIGANAGRMPANSQALIAAGQRSAAEQLVRDGMAANVVLMSSNTRLNFLGDYIVLSPFGDVGSAYSVGDLVALAGEAALVFGMVRVGGAVQSASNKDKGSGNEG